MSTEATGTRKDCITKFWYPMQRELVQEAEHCAEILRDLELAGHSHAELSRMMDGKPTPQAIGRYIRGERRVSRRYFANIRRLAASTGTAEVAEAPATYRTRQTIPNTPDLRRQLRTAMARRDWSYGQLARAAGYDRWETVERLLVDGDIDFFPNMLAGLASALDIDVTSLHIEPALKPALAEAVILARHTVQVRDIPVIAAAHAAELTVVNGILEFPRWEECDKVPAPTDGRNYCAVRVDGNSMAPVLTDGDIVLVDQDAAPMPNKIAVVLLDTDELLVKYWRPVNGHILLASANPDGSDRAVTPNQIQWAKRAVKRTGDL